jgi:hypothetical protein
MTLKFQFKRVYGKPKFYPLNKPAEVLCRIAKRKCLDEQGMFETLKLKLSGCEIEVGELTLKEVIELVKPTSDRPDNRKLTWQK